MSSRDELVRQYKQARPVMGAYRILNTANGKMFIGASPDLRARLNRHVASLRLGSEPNRQLQQDYISFGADAFVFETLEVLEPLDDPGYDPAADLKVLERIWVAKLQPERVPGDVLGYNRLPRTAG